MFRTCKEESGYALVTALLTLLALSIIGATAINNAVTNCKISANVRDVKQAHFIAEGGLSYAGEYLQQHLDQWDSYATAQILVGPTTLGDGQFEVTIEDGGGDWRRRIVVSATTNTGAKDQIEAYLVRNQRGMVPGLVSCRGSQFRATLTTQSYSSSGKLPPEITAILPRPMQALL